MASPTPKEVTVAYRAEAIEKYEEGVHVFLDARVFAEVQSERLLLTLAAASAAVVGDPKRSQEKLHRHM